MNLKWAAEKTTNMRDVLLFHTVDCFALKGRNNSPEET